MNRAGRGRMMIGRLGEQEIGVSTIRRASFVDVVVAIDPAKVIACSTTVLPILCAIQ